MVAKESLALVDTGRIFNGCVAGSGLAVSTAASVLRTQEFYTIRLWNVWATLRVNTGMIFNICVAGSRLAVSTAASALRTQEYYTTRLLDCVSGIGGGVAKLLTMD